MIGIDTSSQAVKPLECRKSWLGPDGCREEPIQCLVPCPICPIKKRQHIIAALAAQDTGHLDQGLAGVRTGWLDEVARFVFDGAKQDGNVRRPSWNVLLGYHVAIDHGGPHQIRGRMHLAWWRRDAGK